MDLFPTAEQLVEALTVESLPDIDVPGELYAAVVEFRHLRTVDRLRRAQTFVWREDNALQADVKRKDILERVPKLTDEQVELLYVALSRLLYGPPPKVAKG